MATYEIPLTPEAQLFQIKLAGVTYSLNLVWNNVANAWVLDIADENNIPILRGIPLVPGVDLLGPYPYLNFGGQLVAQTDNGVTIPPTYDNLGTTSHLLFVTT